MSATWSHASASLTYWVVTSSVRPASRRRWSSSQIVCAGSGRCRRSARRGTGGPARGRARRRARGGAACRRTGRRPPVAGVPQVDEAQHLAGPASPAAAQSIPNRRRHEVDVLSRREVRVQRELLGHVADPLAGLRGGTGAGPRRGRGPSPVVGSSAPGQQPDRRRLAGARRADDAEDRARWDHEVSIGIDRRPSPKRLVTPSRRRRARRSALRGTPGVAPARNDLAMRASMRERGPLAVAGQAARRRACAGAVHDCRPWRARHRGRGRDAGAATAGSRPRAGDRARQHPVRRMTAEPTPPDARGGRARRGPALLDGRPAGHHAPPRRARVQLPRRRRDADPRPGDAGADPGAGRPARLDRRLDLPDPHGHLQATGRDARGRKQYRYHARWREAATTSKFERMLAFGAGAAADPRAGRRGPRAARAAPREGAGRGRPAAGADPHPGRQRGVRAAQQVVRADDAARSPRDGRGHDGPVPVPRQERAATTRSGCATGGSPRSSGAARTCPARSCSSTSTTTARSATSAPRTSTPTCARSSGEDITAKDFRTWAGTVLAYRALRGARARPTIRRRRAATSSRRSRRPPSGSATRPRSPAGATSIRPSSRPTSRARWSSTGRSRQRSTGRRRPCRIPPSSRRRPRTKPRSSTSSSPARRRRRALDRAEAPEATRAG